jgi:hypothetical protein
LVELLSRDIGTLDDPVIVDSIEDHSALPSIEQSTDFSGNFVDLYSLAFEFRGLILARLADVKNLPLRRDRDTIGVPAFRILYARALGRDGTASRRDLLPTSKIGNWHTLGQGDFLINRKPVGFLRLAVRADFGCNDAEVLHLSQVAPHIIYVAFGAFRDLPSGVLSVDQLKNLSPLLAMRKEEPAPLLFANSSRRNLYLRMTLSERPVRAPSADGRDIFLRVFGLSY